MGLFGDRTTVEVQIDRADVMAGDTISARVLVGAPDKKAQGLRVDLVYRNTYQYDTTDSDGDRVTRTRTDDVVVASVPLSSGAPQAGELTTTLIVPPDAPGSAAKAVEWQVRAVVDRRMGGDAVSVAPLYVRAPAAQLAGWLAAPPTIPNECGFSFDVATRYLLPGQPLTGTISLRTAEPVSAKQLEARLRRCRFDPDGNVDKAVVRAVVLLASPELPAGAIHSFPFALDVPIDATPSFAAQHNHQHWYLDVVFNRRMRSDITASLEVVVHTI